jgi:hypothetical protein
MSRRRRCSQHASLLTRLRDWWDFKRGRYERILARMGPFGGLGEPPIGSGVREPRRPLRPSRSGGVAVDLPDE